MLVLPFILDIAIGLVFVYISLSLIASEIQELISTLLEYRAKHLRSSIKYLLMGSDIDSVKEIKQTKELIDELYSNPLIKNLNHQGEGIVSSQWNKITSSNIDNPTKLKEKLIKRLDKIQEIDSINFKQKIDEIINDPENKEDTTDIIQVKIKQEFNKLLIVQSDQKNKNKLIRIREDLLDNTTLPSYIPSETFATTLLEILEVSKLTHYHSSNKLEDLIFRLIKKLREIDNADVINFDNLIKETKEIHDDFSAKKYTLEVSLLRIKARLNELILDHDNNEELVKKITSIKDTFFEGKNFEILCQEMKLSLIYLAKLLETKENKNTQNIEEFEESNQQSKKDEQVRQQIKEVVEKLPKTLKDSMITLAHRAHSKVDTAENDIEQLSKEVEIWFNNSMERASGVYKRNAKGLALVISFFIALIANADSFHIISKLSTDGILREAIVNSAVELTEKCEDDNTVNCIKNTTKENVENLSLPIGWSCTNFQQQTNISSLSLFGRSICQKTPEPPKDNSQIPSFLIIPMKFTKVFLGLMISAVAISMGASFWFDLLNKLVNVRNTGKKPNSDVETTEKTS